MGLFDRVRQAFRGKQTSDQPDQQVETTAAPKMPEVSLSPLPKSISSMPKGQHIDRLGMMHATDIGFGPGFGPDQQGFWEYKEQRTGGHSKADYLEMASHIPEVRERLNNGESLESLMQDSRVGACATQYFSPGNMIQIESHPDGHYEYSTGGRHRIAAAQELGIEIPVQINEYGRKGDYSISPWEKQERYDALMDYMQKHGYSEADRATYEADPKWQRLHSEFDHPVNEWEKSELSEWGKEADSLLEKRYQDLYVPKDTPLETNGGQSDDVFDNDPLSPPLDGGNHNDNTPPPSSVNGPTSRFNNNGSSLNVKDSKVDENADMPLSADAHVDVSTTDDLGTVTDMTGIGSQSSSTPSAASSVSLGDRYQSSYADRIRQTPSLESNRWVGERGESICTPQSDAARQIMEERGIEGIQYRDGVPDFSPLSESTVKLGYMTDVRHSSGLSAGRDGKDTFYAQIENGESVSMSHHADKSSMADLHMKYDKPGNFEQADILTAEQWTADGRDGREWSAEDVAQYRQEHGLTWHECNDMETMQMIPEAINADFGHLGGVAEVREMQRFVDKALSDFEEDQSMEMEDYDRMTPEELDVATREGGYYTEEGVWIPDESPDKSSEEQIAQDAEDESMADAVNSDDTEQATRDLQEVTPDISAEDAVTDEQAVDKMEAAIPSEDIDRLEQATQELQGKMPEASIEDTATKADADDQMEDAVISDDIDLSADQTFQDTIPDTSAENAVSDEQTIDQIEDTVLSDDVGETEEVAQELRGDTPDASTGDTMSDEQIVGQMDTAIPDEGVIQFEQATQELQETTTDDSVENAATDEQIAAEYEQAVQEVPEQETEEQSAHEAAKQEAQEQAAQEVAEQEAEEQAVQESVEQEAYDEFVDEQTEEDFADAEEDCSDLSDEPVEESYDDSDYSDLADEVAEDYVDDSADYSDMADDIDFGSYDDSSFDSSDASFDSGDSGSFDGGGDSIE